MQADVSREPLDTVAGLDVKFNTASAVSGVDISQINRPSLQSGSQELSQCPDALKSQW